jgi:hypothetical protein
MLVFDFPTPVAARVERYDYEDVRERIYIMDAPGKISLFTLLRIDADS